MFGLNIFSFLLYNIISKFVVASSADFPDILIFPDVSKASRDFETFHSLPADHAVSQSHLVAMFQWLQLLQA
jgi:hypothetical protein